MIKLSPAKPVVTTKLTATGCQRTFLDDALFNEIQGFYRSSRSSPEAGNDYLSSAKAGSNPCQLTQLPVSLRAELHASVKPMAEAWVGREIVPTFVYGIRTYLRGAMLKVHRDRPTTHVVSAILNVDQKSDMAWPLLLESEANEAQPWRRVVLAPGELFLYEGSRLNHGRPTAFDGDFYANAFVHYSLK